MTNPTRSSSTGPSDGPTDNNTNNKTEKQPDKKPNKKRGSRVRPVVPEQDGEKPDEKETARVRKPGSQPENDRPHFTVELVGDQVSQALSQIIKEAQYWIKRGRYNKVRISRGGKPLLPDVPVGALLAIEAATFFWAGMLRGVLANIAGNVLFEVELINDAMEHLAKGRSFFLDGDLKEAAREMEAALAIDNREPEIHLAYGSLCKARADRAGATKHLKRALELDPEGEFGAEARRQLEKMGIIP